MAHDFIIVMSTVPSKEAGLAIAGLLVNEKLAACVNIIPGLTSLYKWKGKLCTDEELLLIIKTRKSLFEKVRNAIKGIHPYEVPEIIELPIMSGLETYMQWIEENTLD